jgi:hypothetical protein
MKKLPKYGWMKQSAGPVMNEAKQKMHGAAEPQRMLTSWQQAKPSKLRDKPEKLGLRQQT